MKNDPSIQQKIDAYLEAVEARLQNRPDPVRRDIIAGLREQIHESIMAAGGEATSPDEVDRIIGELDGPEEFEEGTITPAPAAASSGVSSGSGTRWFLLGLAFLLVNAYGVWKSLDPVIVEVERPASVVNEVNEVPVPKEEPPLQIKAVQQVNVTENRSVTLRLVFNAVPNRDLLPRFLRLSSRQQTEISYELEGPAGTNSVWIRTQPVTDYQIRYVLDAGLPAMNGTPPSIEVFEDEVALIPELHLRLMEASSPPFSEPYLRAEFTAFPDSDGVGEYVEVEPAVRYTVTTQRDWYESGLVLTGDFEPGAVYSITFKEGLRASNGSELQQTVTRLVQFPNRRPSLAFDTSGRYLSPRGRLMVPVQLVNMDEWTSSIQPVFANNLVQMALRDGYRKYPYYGPIGLELTGAAVTQTNRTPLQANQVTRTLLSIRDLVSEPRGVYWLGAHTSGRLIVITDLGIAARSYPGGAMVWVNSLQSAEPVEGATITAFARNNQVLAEGVTDADGLVRLEGWTKDEQPFIITARSGEDLSYLDMERTQIDQGPGLSGVAYVQPGSFEAGVFTERGIYRPGETIFMQALVRDDQMQAPSSFPALFRVRRPDGRVYQDVPVQLDAYGAASATVELPAFLPTGRYAVDLVMPGTFTRLGGTSVSLEDFVPPQVRVRVEAPSERQQTGETVTFTVRSEHLFGRVAAGLPVEGGAVVEGVPFEPAQWPDWLFGDPEKTFQPVRQELGRHLLNEEGQFAFTSETSPAWQPPAALRIFHWATVTENGGRPVSAFAHSQLDPYPFYIGLRRAWDGNVRVGETQRVSVVQVRPDGTAVEEGKPVVITLSRVHWNSVLKETRSNRFEWQSERQVIPVREDTLAAGGAPTDWSFHVESMGDYMLVVRDPASGASTRLTFQAASPEQQWVSWSRIRPGRIDLAWDRERYRPGDTARLLVKAPFSGSALLAIESDTVRTARVIQLEKNTAELEIPVHADYAPNVYCTLTLIRPAVAESVWNPHRASGAIALPVDRPGTRLIVETDVPAVQRPQSIMTVQVSVRDEAGVPVQGAVTVMAVDEGICSLTAFETPDLNAVFNAQRLLGVQGHDLYHELMPIVDEAVTSSQSVGGDQGLVLRRRLNPINARRFRPVALWQEAVALDETGEAVVDMQVPEFTGELRVMAVAYNAAQTGSAEQPVQVKRDLIVQPALPRFLAIGDQSDASVVVYNESAEDMTVQVRVMCGGPLRVEESEQSIELAAGASTSVPIPLKAGPGPGKALCRIEVSGREELYQEEIELAVRPAASLQAATTTRILQAGEQMVLEAPSDWMPATIAHSGALSAFPALRLSPALEYVRSYPYGCLEQTVSGLFPFLYADDWLSLALPSHTAQGDSAERIRDGLHRVLSMQQGDGGFSWWPFMTKSAAEPSLYAVHFLVEAQTAGFQIAPERMQAALNWVQTRLDRSGSTEAGTRAWRDDMAERAYAAHILALAGRPNHGWNARLAEQYELLYYVSRVHVAAALLASGEPRQAVPLMKTLGNPVPRERIPGRLLNSDVADAALLLSAWLDIDPANEEVGYLAYYLEEAREDGHWGTTYDNAIALLALGKYERMSPERDPNFTGSLTGPDGQSMDITSAEPMQWSREPGAPARMTVVNNGPGEMVVWSHYSGVSTVPESTRTEGVAITRDVLDTEGKPIDPQQRAQGELMIIRLTVDPMGRTLDQMVIEDLLPAGWEIENPALQTSRPFPWLPKEPGSALYRDARDDRMLFFTGAISTPQTYFYAVRAVTPGVYVWPAATVSGMYEPEIRGAFAGGEVRVVP
jgi:alpha-2-macroglobulin